MKVKYININEKEALRRFERKLIGKIKQEIVPLYRDVIAEEFEDILKDQILNGSYDTLNPNYTAIGIVNTGKYFDSIKNRKISKNKRIVGSVDAKAKALEYGTKGKENKDLKDETMIKWAAKHGFRNPNVAGAKIAEKIRKEGTVEKPHFRVSIQKIKTDNEEIKTKVKKLLKEKLKEALK